MRHEPALLIGISFFPTEIPAKRLTFSYTIASSLQTWLEIIVPFHIRYLRCFSKLSSV